MTYKKNFVLLLLIFCSSAAAYSQQGSGIGQASNDTLINNRAGDSKGLKPIVNLNNYYRLYVGMAYHIKNEDSSQAEANKHTIGLNYSLSEKSFHPYYKARFPQLIGGWDLSLLAGYDGIRRMNYYGVGNETARHPESNRFNWLRTENQYASIGIDKAFSGNHRIGFSLLYDGITVMDDADRLVAKTSGQIDAASYNRQYFLGSRFAYNYQSLDRPIVPLKGVEFTSAVSYTENLVRRGHSFARFSGDLDVYLPLRNQFSFVIRSGLATMTGNPDFYQLNTLGGTNTIRGYQRFRFYGKTAFYNQNEVRWITTSAHRLLKGDFGLFALFDQGRVWHPGESSNKMHYGYGGGVILTLMKKVVVTAAYGFSSDDRRMHVNVKRVF